MYYSYKKDTHRQAPHSPKPHRRRSCPPPPPPRSSGSWPKRNISPLTKGNRAHLVSENHKYGLAQGRLIFRRGAGARGPPPCEVHVRSALKRIQVLVLGIKCGLQDLRVEILRVGPNPKSMHPWYPLQARFARPPCFHCHNKHDLLELSPGCLDAGHCKCVDSMIQLQSTL